MTIRHHPLHVPSDNPLASSAITAAATAPSPPPARPPLSWTQLELRQLKEAPYQIFPLPLCRPCSTLDAAKAHLASSASGSHPHHQDFPQVESSITQISAHLTSQWQHEDRSSALSTATTLAELLSSPSASPPSSSSHYSSLWILVTRILRDFATKATAHLASMPESRRNWQTRVLGISGLIPRLYLSASLGLDLARVVEQCVGIADSLVRDHLLAFCATLASDLPLLLRIVTLTSPDEEPRHRFPLLVIVSAGCQINEPGFFAALSPTLAHVFLLVCSSAAVSTLTEPMLKLADRPDPRNKLVELLALRQCECGPPSIQLVQRIHESLHGDADCIPALVALVELSCFSHEPKLILSLVKDYERRLRFASAAPDYTVRVIEAIVEHSQGRWNKITTSEAFCRLYDSLDKLKPFTLRIGVKLLLASPLDEDCVDAALAMGKSLRGCWRATTFPDDKRLMHKAALFVCASVIAKPALSLQHLVDLRRDFSRVPKITTWIVQAAWRLALRPGQTREYVSSCLAFCLATIPSTLPPFARGALLGQTAIVASKAACTASVPALLVAAAACAGEDARLFDYLVNVLWLLPRDFASESVFPLLRLHAPKLARQFDQWRRHCALPD